MDEYTATEESYKNGYAAGVKDATAAALSKIDECMVAIEGLKPCKNWFSMVSYNSVEALLISCMESIIDGCKTSKMS